MASPVTAVPATSSVGETPAKPYSAPPSAPASPLAVAAAARHEPPLGGSGCGELGRDSHRPIFVTDAHADQ